MAALGRLLVLVYGAAALMCLIWAAMVYTQKMDFVTPKAAEGGKKTVSRVEEAQKKTKELQTAVNRSYTRWRQEFDEVARLEVDLQQRRDFYRGQIELLITGKYDGKEVPDPIQILEYQDADPTTGSRLLKIDQPTGRPAVAVRPEDKDKKRPEEKAKWMGFYKAGIAQSAVDKAKYQMEADDIIKRERASTVVINGQANPFVKGLRVRIKEQEQIEIDANLETAYLEDFVTNRRAAAQLFVKRRDSLVARLNELRKFLKDKTPGTPGE
jgi:hypothetical protein